MTFHVTLQIRAKNSLLLHGLRRLGWSQLRLAEYICENTGLSIKQGTVSRWICLRDYPRNEELRILLTVLFGCSEEELFPQILRDKKFRELDKTIELDAQLERTLSVEGEPSYYLSHSGRRIAGYLPGDTSMEDNLEKSEIAHILKEASEQLLNERERRVLELYYQNDEYTTTEIGAFYGITRSRVDQIRKRALEKLRESQTLAKALCNSVAGEASTT